MNFRKIAYYTGQFFVALTIPATEHPDTVPVEANKNEDGSYFFSFDIAYSFGDLSHARDHARRVLNEHPTWEAGLYRNCDGALVEKIK